MKVKYSVSISRLAAAVLLLIGGVLISSCSINTKDKPIFTYQFLSMGTFFEIRIFNPDVPAGLGKLCEQRVKEISDWGNLFDKKSEISKVNNHAINEPVLINKDFFYVLEQAVKAGELTAGAFDVTVKPLMDYYHIKTNTASSEKNQHTNGSPVTTKTIIPTFLADIDQRYSAAFPSKNIRGILKQVGYQNICINKQNQTVFLKNNAQLDLSGILKGYAVDEIVKLLRKAGITKAIVDGGGNLFCLGLNEKGEPWKVGVKDPMDPEKIGKLIDLEDQAVATSAGYERFIRINGIKYSHIADPRTGKLVPAKGSVSVAAPSAMWADIYSTALFVDPELRFSIKKSKRFFIVFS
ncbi:FAD:protein FMN transferase [Thermoproteota archaeon]